MVTTKHLSPPTLPVQRHRSRPVAWVGGALDPTTRLLKRFVRPGQQYFRWTEPRALGRWLDAHQHQNALVIANSYGASTAVAVVASGHPVAELVTIDPVGWLKPNGLAVQKYCRTWQNFQAADQSVNIANLVAMAGGHWRNWPAAFAHRHLQVPADHAEIVAKVVKILSQTKILSDGY